MDVKNANLNSVGELGFSYPNLLRRYLATLLDLFAWWCLVYAMSRVPSITEHGALVYVRAAHD